MTPSATDGLYPHPEKVGSSIYCDFTNSMTYEGFGMGAHNAIYPGYALMSAANFNDVAIRRAFVALYNAQGGLINLSIGFNSDNCCFKVSDVGAFNLTLGGNYIYPAKTATDVTQCGGPYNDPKYRWYVTTANEYAPLPMPTTYFDTRAGSTSNVCSGTMYPGPFMSRRSSLN